MFDTRFVMLRRGLVRLALIPCLLLPAPAFANNGLSAAETYEPADSLEGNYLAALVAGTDRNTGAASLYLEETLKRDPANLDLLQRALVIFLSDGDMPLAFQAAERVLKRDKDNGLARLALAVRDTKLKRYSAASERLTKGMRSRVTDVTATLLTAWSTAGAGSTSKAIAIVDRLKGEASFDPLRDYHAGLIADVKGNVAVARTRLAAAYAAERTTLRVVDVYGRFLARRTSLEEARIVYKAYDGILPHHPIVQDALSRLASNQALEPAINSIQDGAAEALYGLAAAGNRQGDEFASIVYLRLALYLRPDHTLASITLADILERTKQTEAAITTYEGVLKDSPLRPSVDVQIGLGLETLKRTDDAISHLKEIAEKTPDDIEALTALGNIYRVQKRFPEAIEAYTQAIDRVKTPDRTHWSLFYFRGMVNERAKHWPQAEADLKKALELVPNALPRERAFVLNYLGYSWIDQKLNLDEAFSMLKTAVSLQPRDGYIVDSLGWGYYRLGHYDEAVQELENAIALMPSDPVINDHLGDAYWHVGRKLEATFQWNHARDLGPEPDDLKRILKKIESGLVDEPNDKEAGVNAPPKLPTP